MDVEPTFSNLSEGALDDFLKATYPTLLSGVVFNSGDG
jgi:hypothetical protein